MRNHQLCLLAAFFIASLISGCKPEDTLTNSPVACITTATDTIIALSSFTVNANCSQNATSYSWSAPTADPHTATGATATFFAYQSGNLPITLTVINDDGTNTIQKNIYARLDRTSDYPGTYICNDTCDGGSSTYGPYTLTITQQNDDEVLLTGLNTDPVTGSIGSSGAMTINQSVTGGYFSGYGGLNLPELNRLNLGTTYTVSGSNYSCTVVCIKN